MLPSCAVARLENVPDHKFKKYTAEEFYETTKMEGLSFAHDGKSILVTSDQSKIRNIYRISVPDGQIEQITHSTKNDLRAVSYFPRDNRILFASDQGGNEQDHLYVINDANSKDGITGARDLTPGKNVRALFLGWKKGDQKLFIATNERDPKSFDVYEYSVANYQRRRIFKNTSSWNISHVSPNGRWLALTQYQSNVDINLFTWDRLNPGVAPVPVSRPEVTAEEYSLSFSPDSRDLYYISNQDSEYKRVWKLQLKNHAVSSISDSHWDTSAMGFSKKGRYQITIKNEDAQYQAYVRDLVTKKDLVFPDFPVGQIFGATFSDDEKYLTFYVDGDTTPSDLYLLNLEQGKISRLTYNLNKKLIPKTLSKVNECNSRALTI